MKRSVMAPLLILAVLSAGCGEATTAPPSTDGTSTPLLPLPPGDPPADADWLVGVGTVLDDGDGPELCLGGVAESLPPQCGGPKVVGCYWADIKDQESPAGTTWTGATS